jgi:hypothetical protein
MPTTDSLKQALEQPRDDYKLECEFAQFLLDSYTGRGGYEGRVRQPPASYWGEAAETYARYTLLYTHDRNTDQSYLDRYEREDWPKFRRRVQVAHYLNYVAPIANLYVSYLIRKPHSRSNVPERLHAWIDETRFDDGARLRATRALVLGWFPVVVDMPRADPTAATRQQSGELLPYATELLPCHLLDYQVDDDGVFVWAKTRITTSERESWASKPKRVDRYTIWTATGFEYYEVHEEQGVVAQDSGDHAFGVVPVVIYRSGVTVDSSLKSESALAAICIEARRLFNLISEIDEHMRAQVFAILMIPTREGKPPGIVGNKNALAFDPDARHPPEYLAPPSSVAATYEKRISETVKEIYRMARVEYTRASGAGQSAESRKTEFEQTNLAIADLADSLADAEREELILVGRGLGIPEDQLREMTVTAADSFDTEELNQELERLTQLVTVREFGRRFKSELLKRVAARVLPNLSADSLQEIEEQIEAQVVDDERDAMLLDEAADAVADDEADDDEVPPGEAAE